MATGAIGFKQKRVRAQQQICSQGIDAFQCSVEQEASAVQE